MNEITEEDNKLKTERDLTSPLSLKRPRTHCTVTNDNNKETRFDFLEVLTCDTTDFPSSTSTMQNNLFLVGTAGNGDIQNENPYQKLQNTKLIINPITKVTTSVSDNADMLLSNVYVTAEGHLVRLGKDEHPPVTESDKLCSYLPDEVSKVLVDSHTSKDTSSDMSSHPDCKWQGKSLEDEALVGCCLFTGNDNEGRQVQHTISQIQAFTFSSSDEKVRCRSDCSHKNVLLDTGFCNMWSQYDEVEVSSQKLDEHKFRENIFVSKEEEEGNIPVSCSHCADCKLNYSKPEDDLTRYIAENVRNGEKNLQLHENVAVCDGETKGQVYENGTSKNTIFSVAECAEGSMAPNDVVLARNTGTENVSIKINGLCRVRREHAAGKMFTKAWNEMADHTISARISQEPAEGDNNADLFSVIDPAIWSETDREAEEKHCKPASSAGVELSPSINVCEMEIPPPLCFDVRPSQEVSASHQIRQFNQMKDEKEDLCQSCTECCSITSSEAHNMTSCQCSSLCTPGKLPPAEDERQESHGIVGLQLKEQDQSDSFPISHDYLRTQVAEHSQAEISRMDAIATVKEREDMTSFEDIKPDEHVKLQKVVESEEVLHQNGLHKDDTSCDCISDWIEGEICECNDRSPCFKEKKCECFSDHPYSADVSMMVETTVDKEKKEATDVVGEMKIDEHENSKIVVKSEGDLQQQDECKTDTMEVSRMKCMSEWTESNMSTSGKKLTLVNQDKLRNMLTSCPDYLERAETCMVENTDDHVALISPPTSDAVVPCQNHLSHSQNANSSTTLNCSGRLSPVPSAFTLYKRVPGGFDTFEKIHLSPDDDDDDDDAGLCNTSFLTSLPEQLLKTPHQQLSDSLPGAQSDRYDQASEEKEEGEEDEEECFTEHTANGFLNSDSSCNDLPNFISAASVTALKWSEQQPNCDSTWDSCESIQGDLHTQSKFSTAPSESESPASDVDEYPKFEMKKQFDMVLKELNLFFDISIRDFASDRASSPEQCHDITEPLEADTSDCSEHLRSPDTGCHRNTSTGNCYSTNKLRCTVCSE